MGQFIGVCIDGWLRPFRHAQKLSSVIASSAVGATSITVIAPSPEVRYGKSRVRSVDVCNQCELKSRFWLAFCQQRGQRRHSHEGSAGFQRSDKLLTCNDLSLVMDETIDVAQEPPELQRETG